MKHLVTEDDFRLVQKESEDLYGIEILNGIYEKVVFTFGTVTLNENKETDQCCVNFDFLIHEGNDKYTVDELNDSSDFKNYISEILGVVLDKWDTYKNNDEHTTADT